MIDKPASLWTIEDINALMANQVAESRTLDFKQEWYPANDKGRKDLCSDITAMANTVGGKILIGIAEEDGIAARLTPVALDSFDSERLRMTQCLDANVQPRLPEPNFKRILVEDGIIAIVEVPKSWNAPHWCIHSHGAYRMMLRNSGGNSAADAQQMKEAVLQMAELPERIRQWRDKRIQCLRDPTNPLVRPGWLDATMVIHIIPWSFASSTNTIPVSEMLKHWTCFCPRMATGHGYKINADGIVVYSTPYEGDGPGRYVHVMRNGCVEIVSGPIAYSKKPGGSALLGSEHFEALIIKSIEDALAGMGKLNVSLPITINTTLLSVQGVQMGLDPTYRSMMLGQTPMIEVRDLYLPELVLETRSDSLPEDLKPAFDMVWNAAGLDGSKNYDAARKWNRKLLNNVS
jgi:Putative DNA-binding domain